ncbi:hypothetical protein F511_41015 [Dorcoceras hygrometricum]|uniref:Uncharacterized protein n=1 Tax=Dorcoceras hygrometricum TaxID=472368 RepID=A0A2Z7AG85_9LAMI|nr:hypothetical protein F511_41015 [Dorcoceras hygrometricum]
MLAGFTTEEAEADTIADQGLKRVNCIFGGLNEGIWPKTEELTAKHWNIEEDDESVDTSKSNADQIECHESAASSKESGTSDDNVISDVIVISRSTSRIAKSADGLVMMSSSQDTSRELQWIQSQAFHDQRLDNQLQTYRYNQLDIQTQAIFIQSRATGDPVEGYSALHIQSPKNSAEAQSSSRHESAAKQLTIYESWMSTAERNSNGENYKTQSTLKMERING